MSTQAMEWRPVAGQEGSYEVSSDGQVRSLTRRVPARWPAGQVVPGCLLRQAPDRAGYLRVSIQTRNTLVHVLVAEAFICPRPPGLIVCHNDGNKLNNRAENLRWGTHSDNTLDAVKHGTHMRAARTHCPRGHEFTPENTRRARDNARVCKTCHREREAERRELARLARRGTVATGDYCDDWSA